ncbi:MAG: peptide chain release factor N(5)-glutamine methyltransferase [Nitrospirae bacterium]|nr:peptide chain release factor N(5)-glutamine methyltransferase [Nitrospirota bacterium]MBF0536355.1 peptide chain release factor N(5)-glutamine methyltransferase [Nitrospirota bacterium]MBF0616586.1 peptide chain release factor N(5)-glutamine methyltransferase [Nitrospirota bacterium]
MRANEAIRKISALLKSVGISASEKEAELIVCFTLKTNKTSLYRDNPEITEDLYQDIIARRLMREPLQYITSEVEFLDLTLKVGPGVLIPRPETELVTSETIRLLKENFTEPLTILDLCTGSGPIAISLAKAFPNSLVYGVDISEKALTYARENALINSISNVIFLHGNLFEPTVNTKFNAVISNPPYIKTGDISGLDPEICCYEPVEALDGGADGLKYYRKIIEQAKNHMRLEKSLIVLEIGYDEAADIQKIAADAGYKNIQFKKDYAGLDRMVIIQE